MTNNEPHNLEQLVDRVKAHSQGGGEVALRDVMSALGSRSFGPLLLLPGLVTLAPLVGDIPGVPTLMGIFVVLVCAQLLLGREHFWLPRFLLDRSVSAGKLEKALRAARRPARAVDRFVRPRLRPLAGRGAFGAVAAASLLVGAAMPVMEIVPFSANLAGAALSAFGLALIARDGLLTLLAMGFTFALGGTAAYALL